MAIPATTVDISPIDGITATNVQGALEEIKGQSEWAAGAAGGAQAAAQNAQSTADNAKGTLDGYVAPLVGKMNAEMDQVFAALNLTRSGPPGDP